MNKFRISRGSLYVNMCHNNQISGIWDHLPCTTPVLDPTKIMIKLGDYEHDSGCGIVVIKDAAAVMQLSLRQGLGQQDILNCRQRVCVSGSRSFDRSVDRSLQPSRQEPSLMTLCNETLAFVSTTYLQST